MQSTFTPKPIGDERHFAASGASGAIFESLRAVWITRTLSEGRWRGSGTIAACRRRVCRGSFRNPAGTSVEARSAEVVSNCGGRRAQLFKSPETTGSNLGIFSHAPEDFEASFSCAVHASVERGAQTDEAEVDLVTFERLELLGTGHVEKAQRHARIEFFGRLRASPGSVRSGCSRCSR